MKTFLFNQLSYETLMSSLNLKVSCKEFFILLIQQYEMVSSGLNSFVLKNTSNECYEFLYRKI